MRTRFRVFAPFTEKFMTTFKPNEENRRSNMLPLLCGKFGKKGCDVAVEKLRRAKSNG